MSKKIVPLYGGSQHIEFDDEEHSYRWVEKNIHPPGVTSLLKILQKEALMPWAAKMTAATYRALVEDYVATEPFSSFSDWREAFLKKQGGFEKKAKAEYRLYSKRAADIGTLAHSYAEALGRGVAPPDISNWPDKAKKAVEKIEEFFEEKAITGKPEFVERIVFSMKYFYAGTVDRVGAVEGRKGVYDFKAASYFDEPYVEYKMQLAAYAIALEEEFGITIDHGGIIRLDKLTGKPQLYNVPLTHELKEAFIRTRGLAQALLRIQ